MIAGRNAKTVFFEKNAKKKELDLQVEKVSGRKTETTVNKIHNFFFNDWKKRKTKMNAIDFINIRGQQSFLENSINPNRNKNRKQYGKKHD